MGGGQAERLHSGMAASLPPSSAAASLREASAPPVALLLQHRGRQHAAGADPARTADSVPSAESSSAPIGALVRPSAPSAERKQLQERQASHESASTSGSAPGGGSTRGPPLVRPVRAATLAELPQEASEPSSGRGPAKVPLDLGNPTGREAMLARALAALPPGADYGTVLQGQPLSGRAITRRAPLSLHQGCAPALRRGPREEPWAVCAAGSTGAPPPRHVQNIFQG